MLQQASFVGTFSLGGVNFSNGGSPGSIVEFDHPNPFTIELPAGKAVTEWVKTDFDTAACTLPQGHGQTSGTFDVYWDGGQRIGVPGTVTEDALALDGGEGNDFPASATAGVVVCKQVEINCTIQGDDVQILGVFLRNIADAAGRGNVVFQNGDNESVASMAMRAGDLTHIYQVASGQTNPLVGEVTTKAYGSNGSSTGAATLFIMSGEDSTP